MNKNTGVKGSGIGTVKKGSNPLVKTPDKPVKQALENIMERLSKTCFFDDIFDREF